MNKTTFRFLFVALFLQTTMLFPWRATDKTETTPTYHKLEQIEEETEERNQIQVFMELLGIKDTKTFSFVLCVVGIGWFLSNYIRWIKKAFQVKDKDSK